MVAAAVVCVIFLGAIGVLEFPGEEVCQQGRLRLIEKFDPSIVSACFCEIDPLPVPPTPKPDILNESSDRRFQL